MFHNLKVLRSISTVQKFGGNGIHSLASNRVSAHFLSRLSSTSTPTSTSNKCWQCGTPQPSNGGIQFQCTKCQSLLDVPSDVVWNALKYANHLTIAWWFYLNPFNLQNHFDLFALDRIYKIDFTQLQQKFRKMQSILHPDKFSQK